VAIAVSLRRGIAVAVATSGLALAGASPALARDYSGTALNIIPSGQYGSVPVPPGADRQAKMYDALTPLFGSVTKADLFKNFKSAKFGVKGQGPTRVEKTTRKSLRIVRDDFNVPHITAKKRDDVIFGTGWVTAEDRALLLEAARGPARVAAVDAPGLRAFSLIAGLRSFVPSAQADSFLSQQTALLRRSGPKGRQLLRDIDSFIRGINAYYKATDNPAKPWKREDIYAVNAVLGQLFGEGGGDETRRSMLFDGLRDRLGAGGGLSVFNDLRQKNDPETPVSVDGRFPYETGSTPGAGNAVIDNGSFTPTSYGGAQAADVGPRPPASNFLMVSRQRSTNGHPLLVGGPQIGYFYPGLTLEMDVHGGGLDWRGATSAPFPGYMLIGRGEDFAMSLTSAGSDLVDHYVETLCDSDTTYRYKGMCRTMGSFDAGTLRGQGGEPDQRIVFPTTVHGPVIGYATVDGKRVAISSKRSSRGRDVLFQLFFQDLSTGRVDSARSFFKAASQSPYTFNAAYLDDRDMAMYSAGRLPLRPSSVDSGLPTKGTGEFEWRGFLSERGHPRGINPRDGTLTNWNNKPARGFASADDQFSYGSIQRVDLLNLGLARRRKHDLASVTGAMNRAATQDFRVIRVLPVIARVLRTGAAPNPRAMRMLELLEQWRKNGGSRLDRDLDGKIDHPGAAVLDGMAEDRRRRDESRARAATRPAEQRLPKGRSRAQRLRRRLGTPTCTRICGRSWGSPSRDVSATATAAAVS